MSAPVASSGIPPTSGSKPGRPDVLPWQWPLALSLLLFGMRDWIGLGHRLPLGWAGLPIVALSNKLCGWLGVGIVFWRWRWIYFLCGMLWEWLPSALFAIALALWLRGANRGLKIPRAKPVRVAAVGFVWVLVVSSALSLGCFQGFPHVQDSLAQQFQARIFAAGLASAPVPTHGEFFLDEFLVQDSGRWYAQYPPGQALLLALGVRAGIPWLINPLLGALTGVFLYLAALRAYGRRTALVSLALYCASPFVWFMSAERMNHVGTLFWISLALWSLAPALSRRPRGLRPLRLLLAGVALGFAVSTRPLCGAAAAVALLPFALWPSKLRPAEAGKAGKAVVLTGFGIVLGALPLFLFNVATTGSPLRSGYEVQWGSSGWGFGASQWGPPHTPAAGLLHVWNNWDGLARYLFEWPLPSLIPLLGFFVVRRRTRMDSALLTLAAAVSLAYLPYFFQDLCLGPRFLYAAMPAFVLLSARGLMALGLVWARRRRLPRREASAIILRAACFCAGVGLLVNVPLLLQWYGSSFWGTGPELVREVHDRGIHHAVVFIRDRNRARAADLLRLGVSWRIAHAAAERLDTRWLDSQISTARAAAASGKPVSRNAGILAGSVSPLTRRSPAGPPPRVNPFGRRTFEPRPTTRNGSPLASEVGDTTELEARLREAILQPTPATRRTTLPWEDYEGPSSNVNHGFWANTPWPERQDVIYALHLGDRDAELLMEFPGRDAWLYDWNTDTNGFRLSRMRLANAVD